jgi:hypothetical protein
LEFRLVDNVSDISKSFTQSQITNLVSDLSLKAPISNPTFTGTITGISKSYGRIE